MATELDARALIRAVERPESEEAQTLDRVVGGALEARAAPGALAAVRQFYTEHRSPAFAWMYEAQLRRLLKVEPPKGPAQPRTSDVSLYNRKDLARSLVFSLVVGTALVLINVRPGAATGNPADGPDYGRIFLNYLVPFLVASFSAALANRARLRAARRP